MNYALHSINHAYLGTTVYDMLREALITGRFKPNDRLKIRDIATQVETSVTPVRDAILQLAKEQALEMRTAKDIRVPQLNANQYDEIRTLRLELEGFGAEKAAALVTESELNDIERNIEENMQVIQDGNLPEALRLNSEFHLLLARSAQMPLLSSFINSLWMRTGPLVAQAYEYFSHRMAIEHHQDIFISLRKRDGAAARKYIREDILDGNQKMVAFLITSNQKPRPDKNRAF
ncbi:GntR family transcriptional regulator [Brenneria goodwinii]|uniref:Transcriptional regulator, GntR family n=1 Tax=Brenneria goodwinii TaxID=1109412 RepID=A0A0G4JQ22_9GAMM|nr:GntR family transcriptional regulator [Brenneria goodwinii]MCG8155515.1 GntR family transcriptional regulator [Brenneria goodwinii]MCG8160458.1 GntR family transcriptional regulator [Brenneria goodwinii]MCG8164981.1 GntR family transcriptional regulator [Brenneria goodwinii]MCG8169362.1 GntR family transcriptional regulator [Brenneria goodwinii]MCG8174536.1 GntR family transcriptional regulator [Brenneria goodwinii]